MSVATNIERNIELQFPIEKVKEDIARTIEHGRYTLQSKNDVFNTYRVSKVSALELITMNITLKSIDSNNTNLHLSVVEKIRNTGHQITVDEMIDAFLERLSKALTGFADEELKTVSEGNNSTTTLIIGLVIGLIVLYFILR